MNLLQSLSFSLFIYLFFLIITGADFVRFASVGRFKSSFTFSL